MSADAIMWSRMEESAAKDAKNPLRGAYRAACREEDPNLLTLHAVLAAALTLAEAEESKEDKASAPGVQAPGSLLRWKNAAALVRSIKDTMASLEECENSI